MSTQTEQLKAKLRAGVEKQKLDITNQQFDLLIAYLMLFEKWNKTYNLSAIRDVNQMLVRHLLDSLSVVPFIKDERYIDVGTGGGLPGIPLAIVFPEKQFTLLDSNGKKSRFQFQVASQLELDNITIHNGRVEAYKPDQKFDGVISRAFASLKDMTDCCAHLIHDKGVFLAMKGLYPADELSELGKHYKVTDSHRLIVPGEDGERHLLILSADISLGRTIT